MVTEALKTTLITNLDAIPAVSTTAGEGGPYEPKTVDAYLTTTSGKTVGSTYRMVRLKSTVKVKSIVWEAEAMTQGSFDIGGYYSDATNDGTTVANQGTVIDADFFASAVSAASLVTPTDVTNESTTYTLDKRIQPLWQAIGLTSDPGGFIDIVLTSTNTITAGAKVGIRVSYAA